MPTDTVDILQGPQVMEIARAFGLLNMGDRQSPWPAAGGQDQAVVVGRSAIGQVDRGGFPVDLADPHPRDDLHVGLLVGGTWLYQQAFRSDGAGQIGFR
ncbi:hypothetical protein D3C72_2269380 [compost metagenome]